MKERRLQRKFEWTELPAVLAEGLLRLNGAGVELAESVAYSDDTGPRAVILPYASPLSLKPRRTFI